MAINDPYDRSGQYAGGDTGSPLSNYGGRANDNPDRRDMAVGTMMGEGGAKENRSGYAGILDSIENRISEAWNGANYGQNKGLSSAGARRNDTTLEGMVTARKGAEYNAWSPVHKDAYANAKAGAYGNPKPNQQNMYDQAMSVYDDYYQGVPGLRGVGQGGTFYQNASALTGKQAKPQKDMQAQYGAVPIGIQGHVMTGPGLYGPGSLTGRDGPYQSVDPAITGSFGSEFGQVGFDDDMMTDVQSFTGQDGIDTLDGQPQIRGSAATPGLRGGTPGNDMLMDDDPLAEAMAMLPDPTAAVQKVAGKKASLTSPAPISAPRATAAAPRAPAPAAAPQIGPRESYWTPGPKFQAAGSNATGMETRRTSDGIIHDKAGAYGTDQAFGPDDPFGGLGFSTKGYADVIDMFDKDMGMTRTVKDRQGNVMDTRSVSGSQGEPTVGDGSYSERSGENPNNPQGIL